jgi:IS30 family transposase
MIMKKDYTHLTLKDRERIALLKATGKSLREIAKGLSRSPSTISRELKRNKFNFHKRKVYFPAQADFKAHKRKIASGKRRRLKNEFIRSYVIENLKDRWSPEIIAGRLKDQFPDHSICHEAIYQFVYEEAWHLFKFLPRKRKRRRMKFYYRKPQTDIPGKVPISKRPQQIDNRSEFGHWEADSFVSKASTVAGHINVERKSRFSQLSKIPRNSSRAVRHTLIAKLEDLPVHARKSITYDNGKENTLHQSINRKLGTQSFFCNPYHSWEKGTVENTIGLIRWFIPKKTDLRTVSRRDLAKIEDWLNNRPRKCLNFKTPNEVFNSLSQQNISSSVALPA